MLKAGSVLPSVSALRPQSGVSRRGFPIPSQSHYRPRIRRAKCRHWFTFDKENDMLGQIIANTPWWVWALLAFLIYRGMIASVDREIPLRRTFIIPLVMLALSLQGIASGFGASPGAALGWLASMLAVSLLTWHFSSDDKLAALPQRGAIFQPGSWTPLLLMMAIFITKYVVAVLLAIHPAYRHDALFAVAICALYGAFNGIFIGQLLRIMAVYRRAGTALHMRPTDSFGDSAGKRI
jgi:hypothetical protein